MGQVAAQTTVVILLNLTATFGNVNHSILLPILSGMDITGSAHSWSESYLSRRSFRVLWQGWLLSPHQLPLGSPKARWQGQLLFAIYTTWLETIIRCNADDTQHFLDKPSVSNCLLHDHHLQLNLAKTKLLFIPAWHVIFCSDLYGWNLGVMIDDLLTFSNHVASFSQLCRFALLNIRKIQSFRIQHATKLIIQAMVRSHIDHCTALLTGLLYLVFNQAKRAYVTPLLIELHWLPVAARVKFKSLLLTYR